METPYLPKAIFGGDFEHVYEPAEDTFLLLDALELDLSTFTKEAIVCLECGSGSGTIITALSRSLPARTRFLFATDINPKACRTTRKCADYHQQYDIQVIRTNLAESLVDRLAGQVDVLIFNPPYVPTEVEETQTKFVAESDINLSWAGGTSGRQIIDIFLQNYVTRLLSKPDGAAYMVALDRNDIKYLQDCLEESHNITGRVVLERKAGIEHLHVIKYTINSDCILQR